MNIKELSAFSNRKQAMPLKLYPPKRKKQNGTQKSESYFILPFFFVNKFRDPLVFFPCSAGKDKQNGLKMDYHSDFL